MSKGFVITSHYTIVKDEPVIHLFGRLEDSRSFEAEVRMQPYFFIKKEDKINAEKLISLKTKETKLQTLAHEPVLKVIVKNPKEVPELRKLLEDENIPCFEADIRFTRRFFIDKNIFSVIEIKGKESPSVKTDVLFKNADIIASNSKEKLSFAPTMLSFDIETNSSATKILSISLYNKKVQEVIVVENKKIKKGKFSNTIVVTNEKELLTTFVQRVNEIDPDILVGWNVIDFDLKVLLERAKKLGVTFSIGRSEKEVRLRLQSSFFRDSSAQCDGRIILDGIQLLKSSFIKLDDYKLNTAAKHFLHDTKLIQKDNRGDIIMDLYETNPEKFIQYNLKDSMLVFEILLKSGVFELTLQRSLLTGLHMDNVKASIASFDSLYLRELRKEGYVAPSTRPTDKTEGLGGYVMTSKPGLYKGVLVLDFKSLYPSVMRTFNIDPLSYLGTTTELDKQKISYKDKSKFIVAPNNAVFLNKEGILPRLLKRLWDEREKARSAGNELARYAIKIQMNSMYGVLASTNSRFHIRNLSNAITYFCQHFIKLTAKEIKKLGYEVVYGDSVTKDTEIIVKDDKNNISFLPIAQLFKKIDKKTSEGKQYSFVDNLKTLTIDNDGKSVFKKITYVMRHKTKKNMYRVFFTNHWFIDVTEDHSLIGYINKSKKPLVETPNRLVKVKPTEIGKDIKSIISLKNIPLTKTKTKKYPKEVYEFMGFFVGNGSFQRNKTQQKANKEYYLGLSTGEDKQEVFSKLIKPLIKKGFIKEYWWSTTKQGDITLNGLKLVKIIVKNFKDDKGKKSIPEWLLKESKENICSFLRGLFLANGKVMIKNKSPIIKYASMYNEHIKITQKLLFLAGVSHSVFRENSTNKFIDNKKKKIYSTGSHSKNIIIKDRNAFVKNVGFLLSKKNKRAKIRTNSLKKRSIKDFDFDLQSVTKVKKITYNDFVYDIEVANTHRFFANNVLVHNTDSVFVNTNTDNIAEAKSIGESLQEGINLFLKENIKKEYACKSILELEFEKLFTRFFMPTVRGSTKEGAKKRYAGLKLKKDDSVVLDFTGLEFVRRDWTAVAKEFQLKLLKLVFADKEVNDFIVSFTRDLKEGKYDDLLVYKKALRKDLAAYTKTTPPHVKAARLLDEIKGNIISYVMTVNGPQPIEKITSPLDYNHYVKKQIKPIADSVLLLKHTSFDEVIKGSKQEGLKKFFKKSSR